MLIKEEARLNFKEAWILCESAEAEISYGTVSGRGNFALFLGVCPRKYSFSVISFASVH